MKKWEIFMTKSTYAAKAIANGYRCDMHKDGSKIIRVSYGSANRVEIIPKTFYDQGYFYCAIESESDEATLTNNYELIFC